MLADKIWITRRCRIIASERLDRFDFVSKSILMYYSLFLVILSIWGLYDKAKDFELLTIIGSLVVFSVSIFVLSRNFKERSLALKNCYTQLDVMYLDAQRAEKKEDDEKLVELEKEYCQFLANFENHLMQDYLQLKYNLPQKKENPDSKLSPNELGKFILYHLATKTFVILLFLLPPALILVTQAS